MTAFRKKIVAVAMGAVLAGVAATAGAAETGPVREVFACAFTGDSDLNDLMSARDYYVDQLDRAGIEPSDAFVWTPIAGVPAGVDFLWFNNQPNLNAFGRSFDEYYGSTAGQAADKRFATVADCSMSLSMRQQIHDGGALEVEDNSAIIGASACQLRDGQTMAHVQDLITHLRGVLEQSDIHDSFLAFMEVPTVDTADADLYLYGVHENMSDYAARTTAVQTADSWAMLRRHFAQVLDCSSSLWNGMVVVPAP